MAKPPTAVTKKHQISSTPGMRRLIRPYPAYERAGFLHTAYPTTKSYRPFQRGAGIIMDRAQVCGPGLTYTYLGAAADLGAAAEPRRDLAAKMSHCSDFGALSPSVGTTSLVTYV
jgi:hypothetical protein